MAISTYGIYLMKGTGTSTVTYSKLCDIKSFPNLGGSPELLETTTLSDAIQTFIPGIQSLESFEFEANYDKTVYQTLKALDGVETPYAVWFGHNSSGTPDGSDGQFSFSGKLSVFAAGGGVNEVVNMTITIAPSTEIEFDIPS